MSPGRSRFTPHKMCLPSGRRTAGGSSSNRRERARLSSGGYPAAGGEPERLSEGPGSEAEAQWSPDGKALYYAGKAERAGNLWALSLKDRREYPVTDFTGRRGSLGWALATDGRYLYFTWSEDLGDLWVMDVVRE